MKRIHISNITDIKNDKIYYRNNENILFIELGPCADRYEAERNSISKGELKARCVGKRFFGDYAYYELYTEERTQIYINLKSNAIMRFISKTLGWNFHSKDFQKFYDIQKRLNANGWTTLDLS